MAHLMGLTSTPTVASLAVRYAARIEPPCDGNTWMVEDDLIDLYHSQATRVPDPIERILVKSFCVDDLLHSSPTEERTREVIKTAIIRLGRYELDLCKVVSNSDRVQAEFSPEETRPKQMSLTPADLSSPEPTLGHTSLGLQWDLDADTFNIKTELNYRNMTRRGLLGYIMAPYDPLGMASPVMLKCKLLQREVFPPANDDPP